MWGMMNALYFTFVVVVTIFLVGCSEYSPTDNLISNPFVEIIDPAMNSNVPDSTTIKVATNIDDPVRFELIIDQALVYEESRPQNNSFEYLWYTNYYPDGSQHIIQAKIYDSEGNLFESKYVIVNVFRFRPSFLSAFIKADSLIELTWIDNCSFETGFEIEEAKNDSNFSKIAEVDSNVTSYNLIGSFNQNDRYLYRVRAKSSDSFSGYSNIAEAMIFLNAPINLNIEFISDTAAIFSWVDNNDFETGYVIAKYNPLFGYVIKKVVDANITETAIEDTFITGQYYQYIIYAKMGYLSGQSTVFPYVNFEFPPPYNLLIEGLNEQSIKLYWKEDNDFENGFLIERSSDGINFYEIGRVSSNVISYIANNLNIDSTYSFRIKAFSRFNQSANSEVMLARFSSQLSLINRFQVISAISWMTVSYDASIIAFGGYTTNDVAIYIYDTFTGQLINTLYSADSTSRIFERIAISPDNNLVAAAGDNNFITIWDISSGTVVERINSLIYPLVMKFSYDGNYLIILAGNNIRFYNTLTWQYVNRVVNTNYMTFLDFNSNQTVIATTDGQSGIKLWDFNIGTFLREIPASDEFYRLKFNNEGSRIYGVKFYELWAWDVNNANTLLTIPEFWGSRDFSISESNNIVMGSFNSQGIGLWELDSGNYIQLYSPDKIFIELYLTPNEDYVIGREYNRHYHIMRIDHAWVSPIR